VLYAIGTKPVKSSNHITVYKRSNYIHMLLDNLLIRVKEYNQSLNDTKIYNKN